MDIFVYSIQKNSDFTEEINRYIKISKSFANIYDNTIFNDKISCAQNLSRQDAQKSYEKAFVSKLDGFCVALDENGKKINSVSFASIMKNKSKVSFFIAGAYGFNQSFKSKMNMVISLTPLTMSHQIAKLVLFEQIFRGLSIINNHPYHK